MVQEFDKAWLCDSFALHDINRCHGASLNSHRSQIERYSTKSDFNDNDPGLWTDAINGVRFRGTLWGDFLHWEGWKYIIGGERTDWGMQSVWLSMVLTFWNFCLCVIISFWVWTEFNYLFLTNRISLPWWSFKRLWPLSF